MKINNKGFLLAETIVTVCVIAALATSMYLYISKTTSRFEERDDYENIVDIYKVNTLKQYLYKKNYNTVSTSSTIDNSVLGEIAGVEYLDISYAYLIENKQSALNDFANYYEAEEISRNLYDYTKWLKVEDDDNLRLIVCFNSDDGDGTFASLKY